VFFNKLNFFAFLFKKLKSRKKNSKPFNSYLFNYFKPWHIRRILKKSLAIKYVLKIVKVTEAKSEIKEC